jgi:hypothetical protein
MSTLDIHINSTHTVETCKQAMTSLVTPPTNERIMLSPHRASTFTNATSSMACVRVFYQLAVKPDKWLEHKHHITLACPQFVAQPADTSRGCKPGSYTLPCCSNTLPSCSTTSRCSYYTKLLYRINAKN